MGDVFSDDYDATLEITAEKLERLFEIDEQNSRFAEYIIEFAQLAEPPFLKGGPVWNGLLYMLGSTLGMPAHKGPGGALAWSTIFQRGFGEMNGVLRVKQDKVSGRAVFDFVAWTIKGR